MSGDEHRFSGTNVGGDVALPIRHHAVDHELERFGSGQLRAEVPIALIVGLAEFRRVIERWWWNIERPTPELKLLGSELVERLRLVFSLECPVVAFIESPRPLDRDPRTIGAIESDVGRLDGSSQDTRVQNIGLEPAFGEQLASSCCLGNTLLGKGHIDPAGEEVLLVPG